MRARSKWTAGGKLYTVGWAALLAGLFGYLLRKGAVVAGNAQAYIDNVRTVAPGYPFFLGLHGWIFGDNFLTAAVATQLVLGLGACVWLALSLRRYLSLPGYVSPLFGFLLLMPYFFNLDFGNKIMSEALAYPLFLVVMKYFVEALARNRTGALVKAFLWTAALVLVRKQFLVLYPVFFLTVVYVYVLAPTLYKKHVLLIVLVASVVGGQIAERGWQYRRDGRFAPVPFTGFQIVTAPLFVSRPEDAGAFADEKQKQIFEKTHARLAEKGLLRTSAPAGRHHFALQVIERYAGGYNAIGWGTLLPTLREEDVGDWYRIDAVTREMAWTLAKQNPRGYLEILRLNVAHGAGGNVNFLFLLAFALMAVGYHLKYRDALSLVAAMVSILHLGNILLVALAEPTLNSYVIYTQNLQACLYVAVACEALRRQRFVITSRR